MSDSEIILKYLYRAFPDDHQSIYVYVMGHHRSRDNARSVLMKLTLPIFFPAMDEVFIKKTVNDYLEDKRKLYQDGKIKIKPIY